MILKYRNGVEIFLKFARENEMEDNDMLKCPCKRCKDLKWLDIYEVRFYFFSKGMLKGYKMWKSHGEVVEWKDSQKSRRCYHPEPPRVEQPIVGANYKFYDIMNTGSSNVEEVPNDSAKFFYKVIVKIILFNSPLFELAILSRPLLHIIGIPLKMMLIRLHSFEEHVKSSMRMSLPNC